MSLCDFSYPGCAKSVLWISEGYMSPSVTRIHIQIGFHRVLPYMQFCLHELSPVLDKGYEQALTGLSAQLGQAQTLPTRPGVLPGWPRHVAHAPRARAPRNPTWSRIPPLLDPVRSNKGAGGDCLG